MFVFKHGARSAYLGATRTPLLQGGHRTYASRIEIPFAPPSVPVVERCPSPTCACGETPPGLDIEREQNINGSMPTYAEQVVVSTGKSDWASRIEDDEESGGLVRRLKGYLGKGGKYSDPYHNIMLTHSSFETGRYSESSFTTDPANAQDEIPDRTDSTTSAFLFPSFQYIPSIPTSLTETFLRAFLLPTKLHSSYATSSSSNQPQHLLRQPGLQSSHFPTAGPVEEVVVLICSHNGRDTRCGVLGPLLKKEFEDKLKRQSIRLLSTPPSSSSPSSKSSGNDKRDMSARVGLTSHIGGHKWAGNVIVYIPPSLTGHPLAGKGIWYGRVEPAHVEGIVAKTVVEGKVVKELFRGGTGEGGEVLRL